MTSPVSWSCCRSDYCLGETGAVDSACCLACFVSFLASFLSFATIICAISILCASVAVSANHVSPFISVNLQSRWQGLADPVTISPFFPRSQVTFSFLLSMAVGKRAVNDSLGGRFISPLISIVAHWRMSSPGREHLLKTQGMFLFSSVTDLDHVRVSVETGATLHRVIGSEF